MRLVGLDLGTKKLGVSITDNSRVLVRPLCVIKYSREDYQYALEEVMNILNEYNTNEVVLGFPRNMDGTYGFASERSKRFAKLLEENEIIVHLEDERLTTKSAETIIHEQNDNIKNTKNKIDSIAASLILESYLKRIKNDLN